MNDSAKERNPAALASAGDTAVRTGPPSGPADDAWECWAGSSGDQAARDAFIAGWQACEDAQGPANLIQHGMRPGGLGFVGALISNPHRLAKLGSLFDHPPKPLKLPERYQRTTCPSAAPAIALVTPSYNQACFLEHTISSVLEQRYPNLQYVVMDGGSTDQSPKIIEQVKEQLHHWTSAPDGGQADAINRGFEKTDAPIMAWLNSDDLLLPGALATVGAFFEANPDVDVVYGHRVLIDGTGQEIGRWVMPPHDDRILSYADYVPQETLFWRRSLWERVGGGLNADLNFAIDWDLLLRFREAGARFAVLPRFLGAFRVHDSQKTSSQMEGVGLAEMDRIRRDALGYVPDSGEVKHALRPYLKKQARRHYLWKAGVLKL